MRNAALNGRRYRTRCRRSRTKIYKSAIRSLCILSIFTEVLKCQVDSGSIIVADPPAFEDAYRQEREFYHSSQISEARAELPRASVTEAAKLKGKIASARRQQTIFYGRKPFVTLSGLKMRRANSVIEQMVTEPTQVQNGLIDYWRPIYNAKPFNTQAINKLLGIFGRQCGHLFEFSAGYPRRAPH